MNAVIVLPWILWIVLDGTHGIPTSIQYATYEECMTKGGLLALSIKVDLQLVNKTLKPWCVKR